MHTLPCGCHSMCVSLGRFGSFVPQLLASCFFRWPFRRFLRLLKLCSLLLYILFSSLLLFLILISLSTLFCCCWFCCYTETANISSLIIFIHFNSHGIPRIRRRRERAYFYSRSLKDYVWMMACIVHFMVLRWFDVVIASFRSQHSTLRTRIEQSHQPNKKLIQRNHKKKSHNL